MRISQRLRKILTLTVPLLAGQLFAAPCPISVAPNGMFTDAAAARAPDTRTSANGRYRCTFSPTVTSSTTRFIANVVVFDNGLRLFTLPSVPGSDLVLSNAGYLLCTEPARGKDGEFTLHCYDKTGMLLFSKSFRTKELFGLSTRGNIVGLGDINGVTLVDLAAGTAADYACPRCYQFAISEDEQTIALGGENTLIVYSRGARIGRVETGMVYPRKIALAPDNRTVAIVDKRNLRVYALPAMRAITHDAVTGPSSYNDVRLDGATVWAGVHYRDESVSKGILKTINLAGKSAITEEQSAEPIDRRPVSPVLGKTAAGYPKIPWPLLPQNQGHAIWNNYEALNTTADGDTAFAYMHQGIDMNCPANTRVYASAAGIVKCRLTLDLSPTIYWRIATVAVNDTGWTTGWLYAHLVESTIQFNVGDTVKPGDYIGQIVPWDNVGGHLHFANIRDHGAVWSFTDDEWGITFNPELSLTPNPDKIAPRIVTARPGISKFAYCKNETSVYQKPDSLTGDIDIIVKVSDTINGSVFTQPAYSIYYWIKNRATGAMLKDTTLGEIRNHFYPFYSTTPYHPWTLMQYKVDLPLFSPGGWFTRPRTFAHIITNRCGDSTITLRGKDSCLRTNKLPKAWHRLFVKACDAAGNCKVDSEDVYFSTGITAGTTGSEQKSVAIPQGLKVSALKGGGVAVDFYLEKPSYAEIQIVDIAGKSIATIADGRFSAGPYRRIWKGIAGASPGLYMITMKTGNAKIAQPFVAW